MKLGVATVLVAVCIAAGCSNDDHPLTAPPTSTPTDEPVADLRVGPIVPGAFSPVRVGHPVSEYIRTGYLTPDPSPPCEGKAWLWSDRVSGDLAISATQSGTVTALGTSKSSLRTAEGVHVGSTYRALKAAYGSRLSAVSADDYGGAWVNVRHGKDWIAFSVGKMGAVTGANRVTSIQVGAGRVLYRFLDAC